MNCIFRRVVLLIALAVLSTDLSAQTAFEAATKGAKCTQSADGWRECTFEVGADLRIVISGVGEVDAGTLFSNATSRGDFSARVSLQHRCIVVMAGPKAPPAAREADGTFAFISPRTGLVYRTWQQCDAARA